MESQAKKRGKSILQRSIGVVKKNAFVNPSNTPVRGTILVPKKESNSGNYQAQERC
jgi:hypothetical protein